MRSSTRSVTSNKTGKPVEYTFRKCLIVGDDGTLCEVNWNDNEPMPGRDEIIRARVVARVYRDQVEFDLDELLDPSPLA